MSNVKQKIYAWYEMEQQIMKCWEVVEDLRLLSAAVNNGSDFTTTLKGTSELYEYKFQKLWDLYEQATHERFEERKAQEKPNDLEL